MKDREGGFREETCVDDLVDPGDIVGPLARRERRQNGRSSARLYASSSAAL